MWSSAAEKFASGLEVLVSCTAAAKKLPTATPKPLAQL
jgi:hypothetical protein